MAVQQDAKAREMVDRLDNVVLNIAVTGETGAGMSSFVNAIRGLQEPDEGAAPTGVTETTMEPTMYLHPTMPNVRIWDLPGIWATKFKAKTYMKDVKYQNYDFFIIVSAGRFTENDLKLAKEIKNMRKNLYFVHTKTDVDVTQEERKGVSGEQTLKKIRNNCLENLRTLGPPPVFLITSHHWERFDFPKLVNNLERDVPDNKRDALMSLSVYSKQSIDSKYSTFKKAAWAVAITSGAGCDVAMVVSFLTKCYNSFGLDDRSLHKLSMRVNKPIGAMVKESALVMAIAEKSSKVSARLWVAGVIELLCSLEPGAGNTAEAGVSVVTTRSVLLEGVNELYSVAMRVIEMAELK